MDGLQETDGGGYMCAIYNGSRRFLRRTTVVVETPPVFTMAPEGAEVEAGAHLFMHCQVRTRIGSGWFIKSIFISTG